MLTYLDAAVTIIAVSDSNSFFKSYDTKNTWKNNPGLTILPVQSAMHGWTGHWTRAARYRHAVEGEQKTRTVGNVWSVKDPARCWFTYAP